MQSEVEKREVIKRLQAKINAIQGLERTLGEPTHTGFAPFSEAFPNQAFPIGALHEFSSYEPEAAASTGGFIAALTGKLMKDGALCLWVGSDRKIFPPALKQFGLPPDRIVFIRTSRQKEALWIIEEALKCEALTAVIGEVKQLGFTESRRLQLAVERSGVTGFIHRCYPLGENAVACTTRWKITPVASVLNDQLPGLGYNSWDVQLLKVRNGRPGSWQVEWINNQFQTIAENQNIIPFSQKHAG